LVFTAPNCEPCAEIFPYIDRVATTANGTGVPVTAIVAGDEGQARRSAEKFASVVPFVAEDGTGAFDRYQVRVTPFAFVIGSDGRIQAKGLCNQPKALRSLLMTGGLGHVADSMETGIQLVGRGAESFAERMASS
jgi:hypothetical protein